jgi:radical SAM/Cys-rich protein
MNFIDKIEGSCRRTTSITTLQVNLGKVCNLTCTHCHVNAGPNRSEVMSKKTVDQVLAVLKKFNFKVLDITGGEPAMNPNFKYLIENGGNYVDTIIVRTNLVILEEKGYEDYIDFYVKNKVILVASLPCYTKENTDAMRGDDTFTACVSVLKNLNAAGYGIEEDLELNLVHNPGGDFLPGSQEELENEYKKVLGENHGIKFNHLYAITNLPIGRFAQHLRSENLLEDYMNTLEDNYNGEAAKKIMCRSQISVDYRGIIYDCDFNQMLGLQANGPQNLKELLEVETLDREIVFENHCYGCTAAAGSSCGGGLT